MPSMNDLMPLHEKLKSQVDGLKSLLDEPEMGLMTWHLAVAHRWEAISKLWTGEGGKS